MPDSRPRLVPRSAVLVADTALLRVARTEVQPPVREVPPSVVDRLRSRLARRARVEAETP